MKIVHDYGTFIALVLEFTVERKNNKKERRSIVEALKKVLTVMVVIFVFIIAAGGIYLVRMGNMDHGKATAVNVGTGQQKTSSEPAKENHDKDAANTESADSKDKSSSAIEKNNPNEAQGPVVIQVPVQVPKTDPRFYVDLLKERLKSIDKANAKIAANSGGETVVQSNGTTSSGAGNMNELHEEFYSLGQDIAGMEYLIDNMSKDLDTQTQQLPPVTGVPYGYGQNLPPTYNQYNPYLAQNPYQGPYNQNYYSSGNGQQGIAQGQTADNQSQSGVTGQPGSSQANLHQNHNVPGNGFLNANTIKLIFSLVLIVSVIIAIVSMVGFIGSLFAENVPRPNP